MLTLFHCSDLHFGPAFEPRVGEALLQAAEMQQPDVIVASGDFTMRAKCEQFQAARAFLDRLPSAPLVVTPGNHDVPLYRVAERIFRPYELYREYISPDLDSVLVLDEAVIVSLNSTAPLRAIVNGRISPWQLDFAERAFEKAAPGMARIVVAHHHFAPAPDYEGGQVMPDAKRSLDRFTRLRVDLLLGGHLHRAYIGNSLDMYPGEDREHGIIIVECGTSTSRRGRVREREKNSYNLIRVGDEVVRISHNMFFEGLGDAPGFAPISRHVFPRAGRHHLRDLRDPAAAVTAEDGPPSTALERGD